MTPPTLPAGGDFPPEFIPTETAPPAAPIAHPLVRFLRSFIAYGNPIYLASAASMLLGCLLLTNDLSYTRVSIAQGLSLLAMLAAYQVCLFLAGAALVIRRGVLRDGAMLLVLDAIFLCDVTFAVSNLVTASPFTGLGVGLILAGSGGARVVWLCSKLGAPMPVRRALGLTSLLSLVPLIPFALKQLDRFDFVGPLAFYGLWWLVALIATALITIDRASRASRDTRVKRLAHHLQLTYALLAWVSVAAHVGMLHWVYDRAFTAPMATPLLLLAAVAVEKLRLLRRFGIVDARAIQVVLLGAAAFTGISHDHAALQFDLVVPGLVDAISVGNAKLTFVAVYVAAALVLMRPIAAYVLGVGAIGAGWSLFGPSWQSIVDFASSIVRTTRQTVVDTMPKTRFGWGVIAVVGSFGLLLLGLWQSFRKPAEAEVA
jgi:hypothetical protein